MVGIPENKKAGDIGISEKQKKRKTQPKTSGKMITEAEAISGIFQLRVNTYKDKGCVKEELHASKIAGMLVLTSLGIIHK